MIEINKKEVLEKHVGDKEASKVYVGDKLVHLHKKDNTPFTSRQTCNGEIREGNDLYGTINNIKGNTVVWNQQFTADYFQNAVLAGASMSYSDDVYSLTCNVGSSDLKGARVLDISKFVIGHKYYLKGKGKITSSYVTVGFYTSTNAGIQGREGFENATSSTAFEKCFWFGTLTNDVDKLMIRLQNSTPSGTVAQVKDIQCFDLTQMFGAGNEPSTVEEFEAMFPEDYYPYDAGSLLSFTGTGLKSTWTKEGVQEESTTNFDISAILDGNNNQVFPDGLRKAGSVYDEIVTENGVTKAIKRVGSVDLGTLSWGYSSYTSGQMYFYSNGVSDNKGDFYKATTKNVRYKDDWWSNVFTNDLDKCLFTHGTNRMICITDTSYTDGTSLKASLSGVILYYELATPEEYILSDINLPLYYPANGLGTEEIVTNSTSTPTTAPANMDIEYRLEEEEWYGIRWKMTDSDWNEPKRIGNPNLHRSLPLHNMMKRCALNNGVPKFISDIDPDVYEDGTAVSYSTTNIHVRVPEYYFEALQDSSGNCELRLHTKIKKGTRSRLYYPGAWRAAIDANNIAVSKSYIDFSTLSQMGYPANNTYNASLFKDNTYFVSGVPTGGDSSARSGTEGCTIGRPKTRWDYSATPKNLTISVFRDCAKRNDSATGSANRYGIINYDCWCSIMRLFAVEFCTFNSQAGIDDSLTQPLGFKQGGLSAGVTTVTNAAPYSWNDLNGYNPLIPCGITKSLGNRTDAIAFKYSAGTIAAGEKSVSVPSYRGIEEPFGDIHCFVDGIFFYGVVADFKNYVYVATDETMTDNSYTTPSATPADPSVPPTGYELLTDALPGGPSSGSSVVNSGWSKVWKWDKHGMFVPISYGGNSSNYMRDYAYSYNDGWKMLMAGGAADSGGGTGLGYFRANYGVGFYYTFVGSRLLYTPQ